MRSKAHDDLLLLGRAAASAGCGRVPLQRLHFDRTLTKARDARRRDAPPSKIAAGEKPRFSSNYESSVFVTAYNSRSPIRRASLLNSANHSDSSGLARSLALSFSRVAAARRIPVLPHVLQRNLDSSRAPDTRAGMTEKFDRADVRVTMVCAGLNSRVLKNPAESQNGYWLPFDTCVKLASFLIFSPASGEQH